ncbi:unnamed protein product, partial [Ectocarpus sp. 12 AP-2014]
MQGLEDVVRCERSVGVDPRLLFVVCFRVSHGVGGGTRRAYARQADEISRLPLYPPPPQSLLLRARMCDTYVTVDTDRIVVEYGNAIHAGYVTPEAANCQRWPPTTSLQSPGPSVFPSY